MMAIKNIEAFSGALYVASDEESIVDGIPRAVVPEVMM